MKNVPMALKVPPLECSAADLTDDRDSVLIIVCPAYQSVSLLMSFTAYFYFKI